MQPHNEAPLSKSPLRVTNHSQLLSDLLTRFLLCRILRYSATGQHPVEIHEEDLDRLQPGGFLNETLIEFKIKLANLLRT